tara:strand:+ start:2326 stop:2652 length:327 start_codon:yes stop_codon:yes gene_type:complete
LAALGILGALLASSCCILPLALVLAGVSGAWIGSLTTLEPYKPLFIAVTAVFLVLGFWHVYFWARPECEPGSYCERPQTSIITQIALWLGTLLVLLAATIDWWASYFY